MEHYHKYFPIPIQTLKQTKSNFIKHDKRFDICIDPVTKLWVCDKPPKSQSTQHFHPTQTFPPNSFKYKPTSRISTFDYDDKSFDTHGGGAILTNFMDSLNPTDAETDVPDNVRLDAHKVQAAKIYKTQGFEQANEYLYENNIPYEIIPDNDLNKPGVILESQNQNRNGEFDYEIAYPETDLKDMADVKEAIKTHFADSYDSTPPYIDKANEQFNRLLRFKGQMPNKMLGGSKGGAIALDVGSLKGVDTVTFNPLITNRFINETYKTPTGMKTSLSSPNYIMGSPNRRMRWGTRVANHTIHRTTTDFASIGLGTKNSFFGSNLLGDATDKNVTIKHYTPNNVKGYDPFESHYLKQQFIKPRNENIELDNVEHPLVKYNKVKDAPALLESAKSMIEFKPNRLNVTYTEWALKHEPSDVKLKVQGKDYTKRELDKLIKETEKRFTLNAEQERMGTINRDEYEQIRDDLNETKALYKNAEVVYGPRHSQSKLPALWRKLGFDLTETELQSGEEFTKSHDDIDNLEISDDFLMNKEQRNRDITKSQGELEGALNNLNEFNEPAHEIAEQFDIPNRLVNDVESRPIMNSGRVAPIAGGALVAAPAFAELGYQIKGKRTPDALRIGNKLLFAVMSGANPLMSTFINSEISKSSDETYVNKKALKQAYRLEEMGGSKGVDLQTSDDGSFMGTDTTTGDRVKYVEYP